MRFLKAHSSSPAIRAVAVFLLLTASTPPAATQDSAAHRYTLPEAVQTAMRLNHDLASSRLEAERASARVQEAWGYALPKLDLQAQYSRALKKQVFFLPDFNNLSSGRVQPVEIGSDNSVNMSLSASQVIFNSAVFTGVGTAHVYREAAQDLLRAKQAETVGAVRKAFYNVLVAQEVVTMMHESLTNAEENLRNVRALTTGGLASEYDLLRAEVGLANLRPEVINAETGLTLALNGLKVAMGIPFEQEIAVEGSLLFEPVPDTLVATAVQRVLDMNPNLSAARHQIAVNDAFVAIERSSYLPTLAAFGNYQWQAQKNDLNISAHDLVSSAMVGLSLSMNLFTGFQTNARVEQASLERRKSEEQVAGLETSLRTLVESIIQRLKSARERVEAQGKTVEQARKGYRIATTRFTSGAGTQLEVRDALLAQLQAGVNRIQAVSDYLVASAELDQALGRFPDYAQGVTEE
jgi:outer membrane protein